MSQFPRENPPAPAGALCEAPPWVDIVVEIPRGGFLKRGAGAEIDFVSPLPCPYNYGSVPQLIGLEGDLLDALVLGPRLPRGAKVHLPAWGAIVFADRGMIDDKLVCSERAPSPEERRQLLRFFTLYARCKAILNFWRRQPGRNDCDGWCSAEQALARARPRWPEWRGPQVSF